MNIQIKRGDSLDMTCTDSAGDLTGIDISASVKMGRSSRPLVVDMIDAANGIYSLSAAPDETETWPIGCLRADIKYAFGDIVGRTYDFFIHVSDRVTP